LFRTPRDIALSYVEGYIDYTGRITGYEVFDLRILDPYQWRLASGNVWKVERLLLESPHRSIVSSDARIDALRRRYFKFRTKHDYKPWKSFKGQSRWTPLPQEFRRRG